MSAPLPNQTKFALVPDEQMLAKTNCAWQPNPEAIAWTRGTLYVTNLRVVYCDHSFMARMFAGSLIFLMSAKTIKAQIDPANIIRATVEPYALGHKVALVINPGGWIAFPGLTADRANQIVGIIGQVHNAPHA